MSEKEKKEIRKIDLEKINLQDLHEAPGIYNLIRFRINQAIVTVANMNYTAAVPSATLQIAIT